MYLWEGRIRKPQLTSNAKILLLYLAVACSNQIDDIAVFEEDNFSLTPTRCGKLEMSKLKTSNNQLSKYLKDPSFSAATAALGAIVGLFGSIFSTEIKGAFPFAWGEHFVWQAAVFYVALALFAYCFRWQMFAQAQTLEESSERLERLIRTLPPDDFLRKYESFVVTAGAEVVRAGDPAVKHDGVNEAIQVTLLALLSLAKLFDGNPKSGRYAINIMTFKESPTVEEELKSWGARISFLEGSSLTDIRGALELNPEFALVLPEGDSEKPEIDSEVGEFALPIPTADSYCDSHGRNNILPGAPHAFCFPNEPAACRDTATLIADWSQTSGLRPEVADRLKEYFESDQGSNVRSFVSLPIFEPPEKTKKNPHVIGVVNIHSDQPGILADGGKDMFFPLATTFTLMLGALLRKLSRLGST